MKIKSTYENVNRNVKITRKTRKLGALKGKNSKVKDSHFIIT